MKHFYHTLLLSLFGTILFAQTTLGPGDIAFTLINMDGSNTDALAFVLLKDISPNTTIVITDDEYTGSLTTGEGRLVITFTSAFSCGTEFFIQDVDPSTTVYTFQASTGPGNTTGLSTSNVGSGSLSLSSGGETLIAFQDSNPNTTSPAVYISALANTGVAFGGTATGSGSLPPGLTVGLNALALPAGPGGAEIDNYKYNCTIGVGTASQISTNIYTAGNWSGNNDTPYPVTGCGFTCLAGCDEPVLTSVSPSPNNACPGVAVTLNINGSLGDAPEWRLHEGSCSNPVITTTTGSSFSVNPSATTTYFISVLDCNSVPVCASVTVTRLRDNAVAGPDQLLLSGTSTTLTGNSPSPGNGIWSIISGDGNGSISTPTYQTSSFSGTAGQAYVLRWTVNGGGCSSSFDDVEISFAQGTTDLVAGDLAFTGYNSDAPDEFTFAILREIAAGTIISFTDMGWLAAGGFRTSAEGQITLSFDRNYNCGDVFYLTRPVSPTNSWVAFDENNAIAGSITEPLGPTRIPGLATIGDQLFAFQGALNAPTLLAGIHVASVWSANAVDNKSSAQPPALTGNNSSVNITTDIDNAIYNCAVTSGLPGTLATAINTASNWNISDDLITLSPTCDLDCQDCNEPIITSVDIDLDPVCQGTPVTLTVNGSLNGANRWAVYETSCGVNQLATSTTNILVFNPDVTKTYYVAGVDGCVATPTCTLITINVSGNEADIPQDKIVTVQGATATTIQPFPPQNGQIATLEFIAGDGLGSVTGPTGSNVWTINGTAGQTYRLKYSHIGGTCPTTMDEFTVVFPLSSTLALGDIAFTGINTNSPDGFSFAALTDINAGTTITFTIRGWLNASGFHTSEGTMNLELCMPLACGESVFLKQGSSTEITSWTAFLNGTTESVGNLSQVGGLSTFAPTSTGDQIFAYQGTEPTAANQSSFLAGIHTNCNNCTSTGWDGTVNPGDTNDSERPSIFSTGTADYSTNIGTLPETGNAQYDCTIAGNTAPIRSQISDEMNWTTSATAIDLSVSCLTTCDAPPIANCQAAVIAVIDASGNLVLDPASLNDGSTDDNTLPGDLVFSIDFGANFLDCDDVDMPAQTISLIVTDNAGLTNSCTSQVTIEDNIAPVVTCQNIVADLDANGTFNMFGSYVSSNILTSYSDNCATVPDPIITGFQFGFSCNDLGINNEGYFFRDRPNSNPNKLEDFCAAKIQINDPLGFCGTDPVAVCQDFSALANTDGTYTLDANSLDNGSTDDGSVYSLVFDPATDRQEHLIQDCNFAFQGQGQSFTAGQDGVVQTIRVRSATSVSTTLHLYAGDNGSGVASSIGTPLYSQAIELFASPSGALTEMLLATPFPVSAGSEYTFVLEGVTSLYYDCGGTLGYLGGRTMLDYVQWSGGTNQDYTFQVDIIGETMMDFNTEGSYPLDVYAVDNQGNVSPACNATFTLENLCIEDRQINDNPINSGLYEVYSTISSGGVISAGDVDFSAKTFIELQAGFEVINGNEFHAYIEGCDGPIDVITNMSEEK